MTSTNKRDGGEVERGDALKLLIGTYWQIAYNEGRQGRTTDTPEGDAQRTWSQIEALIDAQERALAESRRDAMDSSMDYIALRERLDKAEARAERLAGALREVSRYLDPRQFPEAIRKIDAALEQEPQQ